MVHNSILLIGKFGKGTEYPIYDLIEGVNHTVGLYIDYDKYRNPLKPERMSFLIKKELPASLAKDENDVLFEGNIEIKPDSDRTELACEVLFGIKNIIKY